MLDVELYISMKNKIKAKKRRAKNEKKWIPLRTLSSIALIITIVAFVIGIIFVPYGNYFETGICGAVFAVFLIVFVVMRAVLSNLTSHWITDRLNERIWISGNTLNHFVQTSFAAGINSRSADEKGYLFQMDISSIKEAVVDTKSGRIEFKANGIGYHYSNVVKDIVDNEWPLNDFSAVFYDYTEPSLQETLESCGVIFERKTLDFKIRDNRI